jgi:hypothetical protein
MVDAQPPHFKLSTVTENEGMALELPKGGARLHGGE